MQAEMLQDEVDLLRSRLREAEDALLEAQRRAEGLRGIVLLPGEGGAHARPVPRTSQQPESEPALSESGR